MEVAHVGAEEYSAAQARRVPWSWGGPSGCSVVRYTEEYSVVRARVVIGPVRSKFLAQNTRT